MSTGIVSKTGLTGATINGTVYEGTAYDKITTAADAESLVAVAGGTYSDGQITMNGDTIIGGTAAPVVISGNVNTSQVNTCYGGGAAWVNGGENTISGVTFSENSYNGKTSGLSYISSFPSLSMKLWSIDRPMVSTFAAISGKT